MRTPQQRLTFYKSLAKKYNSSDWRQCRYPKKSLKLYKHENRVPVENLESCFMQLEGFAGDFARLGHTGWYADSSQDELVKGAVMSIRTSGRTDTDGGHFTYFPAITYTQSECDTVFLIPFDDKREAALYADQLAEEYAEKAREGEAEFMAEQQIEDLKSQLHTINQKTLAVIKELKKAVLSPALCAVIRENIENAIEERTGIFKRIEALNDNYWLAVE